MKRACVSECRECGLRLINTDGRTRHLCSRCAYPVRAGVITYSYGDEWVLADHFDDVAHALADLAEAGAEVLDVAYDEPAEVVA